MPSVFIPSFVSNGSYYLLCYIDPSNGIGESNETNNARSISIVVGSTNGVNDNLSVSNSLSVYPNPNNGAFNVTIGNAINQNCTISILNSIGEEVATRMITASPSGLDEKFLLDRMASGLYTLKIEIGEETWFRKVSIEK